MMIATALVEPNLPFELGEGELDAPVLIETLFDGTGGYGNLPA
jgi:hypothetical protein